MTLDFPKIKKLGKVYSAQNISKKIKISNPRHTLKLLNAFKMVYSCCFRFGRF